MQRATEKRQLEALVIAKGKFKSPTLGLGQEPGKQKSKQETMAEMAASLLRLEGEKIQVVPEKMAESGVEGRASVLSDKDLDMLLDRRPVVFVDRQKGWNSNTGATDGRDGKDEDEKAAFAVYNAPKDAGNDMLARMLGEGIE